MTARPKLLTVNQVAEQLGCGRAKVVRLIVAGELPAANIGNPVAPTGTRYRVDQSGVDRWLESRAIGITHWRPLRRTR